MPEGFGSIDDLKVAITAHTEPLEQGISSAKEIIAQFSSRASVDLSKVDAALDRVAKSVAAVRTTLMPWMAAMETALGLYNQWMGQAEGIAAKLGKEEEFQRLKKSIDGIGESFDKMIASAKEAPAKLIAGMMDGTRVDGVGGTVDVNDALKDSVEGVAEASAEGAEAQQHFADSAAKASAKVRESGEIGAWVTTVTREMAREMPEASEALHDLAEAAKEVVEANATGESQNWGLKAPKDWAERIEGYISEVRAAMESFVDDANKSDAAIEGEMRTKIAVMEEIQQRIDRITAGRQPIFSRWLLGTPEEQIEAAKASIERIKGELDKLREQRQARGQEDDSTEGFEKALGAIEKQIAGLEQKARIYDLTAGEAARLVAQEKLLAELGKDLASLNEAERTALTEKLDALEAVHAKLKEMADDRAMETAIDGVEREIAAIERRTAVLGMSASAAAAYNAEAKVMDEAARRGRDLTDAQADRLQDAARDLAERTAAYAARQGTLANDKAMSDLDDQIGKLTDQVATFDMGAGAAARYRAEMALLHAEMRSGVAFTEAERNAQKLLLDAMEELTDRKKFLDQDKQFGRDITAAERTIEAEQKKIRAYGMEADALAVITMEERLLTAAKLHNLELDDQRRDRIQDIARAYGEVVKKSREMETAMHTFRDVATATSRTIEQSFSNWITGTHKSASQMLADLLRQISLIALRASVLNPLFGNGQPGNGLLSQVFGGMFGGGSIPAWQTSTIPAFAGGGRFEAGVPMLVGERRPEVMVPDVSGRILPNADALGGGGGGPREIVVRIEHSEDFHARVEQRMGSVVDQRQPAIVGAAVDTTRRVLPGMLTEAQRRSL